MRSESNYQCRATGHVRSITMFRAGPAAAIALALCLGFAAPALGYGVKGVMIVAPTQGAHYVKGPVWLKLRFINKTAAVKPTDWRLRIILHRYEPAAKTWSPVPPHDYSLRRLGDWLDLWPYIHTTRKYRIKARRKALGVHVWSDWVYFSTGPYLPKFGKKKRWPRPGLPTPRRRQR